MSALLEMSLDTKVPHSPLGKQRENGILLYILTYVVAYCIEPDSCGASLERDHIPSTKSTTTKRLSTGQKYNDLGNSPNFATF